jgi:hypothetical protein
MSAQIIVLSDHRAARARQAAKSASISSCEVLMQTGFLSAFAWLNAMDDAAKLWLVPWPGGIDDLNL